RVVVRDARADPSRDASARDPPWRAGERALGASRTVAIVGGPEEQDEREDHGPLEGRDREREDRRHRIFFFVGRGRPFGRTARRANRYAKRTSCAFLGWSATQRRIRLGSR